MENIYSFLKECQEEMLDKLRFLVELESPSLDKELNDTIGYEIAKLFKELTGGTTSVLPMETYGNHYRAEWGAGEEQILILAHFDTVWPQGTLESMPFEVRDGKAYGPGVFDMKGGIVQGLFALHALSQLQEEVGCRIVFLFNSDEEIGSPSSQRIIEEEARRSKCVFVLEPAMSTAGALKTSRKGVGIFSLHIKGKPVHSGIEPEKGHSAISELAHQILYVDNLTDFELGTTLNVGVVQGGTRSNVVAAEAQAEIDLRVKTNEEFERIVPLIKGLETKTKGVSLQVTGGINRPPLERTEHVAKLFEMARQLAKKYLNFDLLEKETGGGSDGNFTAPLAPTLDGLGAVGDGAHATHEHLVISEMPTRSALLALLIKEISFVSSFRED